MQRLSSLSFCFFILFFCSSRQDRDCNGINLMQFLQKGVSTMDVHHNLPKKPTSFSSDFALALSICLCFYFCNICIHVGIYCCLMSHTSMITSEISHRFGRVQLMKSFVVWVLFCFFCLFLLVHFFFPSRTQHCLFFFFFFYAQNTRSVFNIVPAL